MAAIEYKANVKTLASDMAFLLDKAMKDAFMGKPISKYSEPLWPPVQTTGIMQSVISDLSAAYSDKMKRLMIESWPGAMVSVQQGVACGPNHGSLAALQARLSEADLRLAHLGNQLGIADRQVVALRSENELLKAQNAIQSDMLADLTRKLHAATNPAPVAAGAEPRAFPAQALAGRPTRIGLITTVR